MSFKLTESDVKAIERAVESAVECGALSDQDLEAAAGGGIMDYLGNVWDAVTGGGSTEQENNVSCNVTVNVR